MGATNSAITRPDGSLDWSNGIDSVKVTTVASESNPNGLPRNCLAWLINGTVRDGGISPRDGWQRLGAIHPGGAKYQGGWMYLPDDGNPYLVVSIGGSIFKADIDPGFSVTNLTAQNPIDVNGVAVANPSDPDYGYFQQAEQFLVIQAGDGVTLPLFWDNVRLRRSNGLTGNTGFSTSAAGTPAESTGASYDLNVTVGNAWNIPNPGVSVVVNLVGNYPGAVGDVGDWGVLGTFEVTAIGAGTVTLRTISSNYVGVKTAGPATFVVHPSPGTNTDADNPSNASINEIPAARQMDYYMNRLWYAQGWKYSAGDIVLGANGTLAYGFRDSVLKVTENPLALGGDGFAIPDASGQISALKHAANINEQLGQGLLYIHTPKSVYSLKVPVARVSWIQSGNSTSDSALGSDMPLQAVIQLNNGSVNDRSVTLVNGDQFYQSLDPGVRSLASAVRNFPNWANIDVSAPEFRVLQALDRSLLGSVSGIYFNQRLLMTTMPIETPVGTAYQGIMPLDFVPLSTIFSPRQPNWEGIYEGLKILQLFTANFSGRERAFAVVYSDVDGAIDLWELVQGGRYENGDGRIQMVAEFPAFTWQNEFELKRLVSAELWIDRINCPTDFLIEYRPDGETCWIQWYFFQVCTPRDWTETAGATVPKYVCGPSYRATVTLPVPPVTCEKAMNRPSDIAYQFQVRLTMKGSARIRGLLLHAMPVERKLYEAKVL